MLVGGPLVSGVMIAGIFVFYSWEEVLSTHPLKGFSVPLVFICTNLLTLVINLIPRKTLTPYGVVPNDGLALAKIFFLPTTEVQAQLEYYFLLEGAFAGEDGNWQQAREWYGKGLISYPESATLRHGLAVALINLRDFEAARKELLSLVSRGDLPPPTRALIMNNIAWSNLMTERKEYLEEADRYSEEAFTNLGSRSNIRGTRGSVLVELGRIDEGLELLRAALRDNPDPRSKALNACYIALALKEIGEDEEGRHFLDTARNLDPNCVLIPRVMARLGLRLG